MLKNLPLERDDNIGGAGGSDRIAAVVRGWRKELHWGLKPVVWLVLFGGMAGVCAAADKPGSAHADPVPTPTPTPAAAPAVGGATAANVDTAAAPRNENVAVNQIDTDGLKEANIRRGDNLTFIPLSTVEFSYFGAEHGRPPSDFVSQKPNPPLKAWHAELYESAQSSIFNARTFFQVGRVKPSHLNQFGGRFSGNIKGLGSLSGSIGQRHVRGMVNGNVLVPKADERTPLATDPAVRAIVQKFLNAYPKQLPNRPDFDERMLNTNAAQIIDETDTSLRLDRQIREKSKLVASHTLSRQNVHAFQLVAGQNPDNQIHSQRARLSLWRTVSARTEFTVGAEFQRTKSVLLPEPNAVGPRVRVGYQIDELGPDSHFPINRANNTWKWGFLARHQAAGSRHQLTAGGDTYRYQLNGVETYNSRGLIFFASNYGRTAIDNLRMGTPTTYEGSIGELERGFRNLSADFFAADNWRVSSRLQIYYGLRYNLVSAPVEVNNRDRIPYGCDCNNFSPRLAITYQLPHSWILRTHYTVSYGEIMPVTYQQIRFNPPVRYVQVQDPDLVNPLKSVNLNDPNGRTSITTLAPDMVSPYAHQYNLQFERRIGKDYALKMGYVGSRSLKLLNGFVTNRAVPVDGIPLTTGTVDERRPDPRYYEVKQLVNGGIAYLDFAQAVFESRLHKGLQWSATYSFGKAIDEGVDYVSTAANRDMTAGRAQSQYESFHDRKGPSNFDSTHTLLLHYSYDLPRFGSSKAARWTMNGWMWSGSTLMKTGTPLTLFVGSDAPGFGNVDGSPSDRPNILDPSILGATISNPTIAPQILRRDRFGYITPGDLRGSLGRGTFRKGGIANFNTALSRQWRLPREKAVVFRAEAYNLTNHPQFDEPNRNLNAAVFGKITNTLNDGRVFQFSLRIIL